MCFSRIPRGLPEVFVCDLVDILTKELFGGIFEDVFQEALRASALISHQLSISRFSQSAFRAQVKDYVTMGFYESTFTSLFKVIIPSSCGRPLERHWRKQGEMWQEHLLVWHYF